MLYTQNDSVRRMDERWFERLLETVERDGRSARAISLAAGLAENFVQQMVKYRKKPKVGSLVQLLGALGSADTLFIITGSTFTDEDRRLLDVAAALDDEGKRALIAAFAALRDAQQ